MGWHGLCKNNYWVGYDTTLRMADGPGYDSGWKSGGLVFLTASPYCSFLCDFFLLPCLVSYFPQISLIFPCTFLSHLPKNI